MIAKDVPKELLETHQDRPAPKRQLPFRIVPITIGGKPGVEIEYDQFVPMPDIQSEVQITRKLVKDKNGVRNEEIFSGTRTKQPPQRIPKRIPVETPQEGCYNDPHGFYIIQLIQWYREEEAKIDGLQATIDKVMSENVILKREVERLTNQLVEAKRPKKG